MRIMDFLLTDDIKLLKQTIKDFIDSEVDLLAAVIEETD
jgi:acyl-CoA dehydrogenase